MCQSVRKDKGLIGLWTPYLINTQPYTHHSRFWPSAAGRGQQSLVASVQMYSSSVALYGLGGCFSKSKIVQRLHFEDPMVHGHVGETGMFLDIPNPSYPTSMGLWPRVTSSSYLEGRGTLLLSLQHASHKLIS